MTQAKYNSQALDRFLTFDIGKQVFAIPLLTLKEVIGPPVITPMPQAPSFVLGMINLRGRVIPIVDLRKKLGFVAKQAPDNAVMICDLKKQDVGFYVDAVLSVLTPNRADYTDREDLDSMISKQNGDWIQGVYKNEDRLIVMIEPSRMIESNVILHYAGPAPPVAKAA